MNLIEKFGSYESAKKEFESLTPDQYGYRFELQMALLEHRRQHNIFEVGDKVVSRCADRETRVFKYETTIGKNIVVKCKRGKGYCYPKKWFSHATPEELEAGRRL